MHSLTMVQGRDRMRPSGVDCETDRQCHVWDKSAGLVLGIPEGDVRSSGSIPETARDEEVEEKSGRLREPETLTPGFEIDAAEEVALEATARTLREQRLANSREGETTVFILLLGSEGTGILCSRPHLCGECSKPRNFFRNRHGRTRCLGCDDQFVLGQLRK